MSLSKNALLHGFGEIGSRVPLVVLELFLARVLGPSLYGLWAIVQTIVQFGNFLHFGAVSALARIEPSLHSRKNVSEIKELRGTTYGLQIIVTSTIFVSIIIISNFQLKYISPIASTTILVLLWCIILIQQIQLTAQSAALNELQFKSNSESRLLYAFCFMIAGAFTAYQFRSLAWLLFAWIVTLILSLLFLLFRIPSLFAIPRFDFHRSRYLITDGFPIFAQGLLRLLISNCDRLILMIYSAPSVLGEYSLGTIAGGLSAMISSIVTRASLPEILRKREECRDPSELYQPVLSTFVFGLVASSFVTVIISTFFPLVVWLLLPQYGSSIWLVTVLSGVGLFVGMSQTGADFMLSFGLKRSVLMASVALLLALGGTLFAVWHVYEAALPVAIVVLLFTSFYAFWIFKICFRKIILIKNDNTYPVRKIFISTACVIALSAFSTWIQTWLLLYCSIIWILMVNIVLVCCIVFLAFRALKYLKESRLNV